MNYAILYFHKVSIRSIVESESNERSYSKQDELRSVHDACRSMTYCTAVQLREYLQKQYSEIWGLTGNAERSDEKRIRRILDKLVGFGLAAKEKKGKEYHYTYLHNHDAETWQTIDRETHRYLPEEKSYYHRRVSLLSKLNNLSPIYYIQTVQEDISHKEEVIIMLERAIANHQYVKITYNEKPYKLKPLRIVQFDGYWYLVVSNGKKYYKYRIRNIPFVTLEDEHYTVDDIKLDFDTWHNIMHDPNEEPTRIKLFISQMVFHYFEEKNILHVNRYRERLVPCSDGWEYELYITHEWELLPVLMQWQKYVTLLDQEGKIDMKKIYHNILQEAQGRLDISDLVS